MSNTFPDFLYCTNQHATGLAFAGADGQTLQYDQLKAYDSTGEELNAQMILNPAQVIIQMDGSNAIYSIKPHELKTHEVYF